MENDHLMFISCIRAFPDSSMDSEGQATEHNPQSAWAPSKAFPDYSLDADETGEEKLRWTHEDDVD
jgi:hypothetical protein